MHRSLCVGVAIAGLVMSACGGGTAYGAGQCVSGTCSGPTSGYCEVSWVNALYKGPCVNGQPQGTGTTIFDESNGGATYLGEYVHGQQEGQGIMSWKRTGDIYQGA